MIFDNMYIRTLKEDDLDAILGLQEKTILGLKDSTVLRKNTPEILTQSLSSDNIALGANFLPYLEKYPNLIKVYEYPSECYSSNVLLKNDRVILTPSSYNLTPVKEIKFNV